MKILFLLLVVLYIHQGDFLCTFPCSRLNRVFHLTNRPQEYIKFSKDLTSVYDLSGYNPEPPKLCWERSGPFYALRIHNGTHPLYFCIKDTVYDTSRNIEIFYSSPYKYFKNPPTICDVCIGCDLQETFVSRDVSVKHYGYSYTVKPPPLGCNIPKICPVTMAGQYRCTGCEPSESDEGLCC